MVGAGPAGLATGIALRRSGVRVLVVDKHPGTSVYPKATVLRTRGLEILRSWGLEQRIRRVEQALRPQVVFGRSLAEPPDEVRSWLPRTGIAAASSPTTVATVSQDQLEALLLEHLTELGGEVRFGTELVDFDAGADVTASLFEHATAEISLVEARFLVAADGSRSPIRNRLGIESVSYGSRGEYGTALVRFSHPGRHSIEHVITSPLGASLFFPSAPGRWAFHVPASRAGPAPAGWTKANGSSGSGPRSGCRPPPSRSSGPSSGTSERRPRARCPPARSFSSATPLTGPPRTAGPEPAWRSPTHRISPGSWPTSSAAGRRNRCWTATTPSAGRSPTGSLSARWPSPTSARLSDWPTISARSTDPWRSRRLESWDEPVGRPDAGRAGRTTRSTGPARVGHPAGTHALHVGHVRRAADRPDRPGRRMGAGRSRPTAGRSAACPYRDRRPRRRRPVKRHAAEIRSGRVRERC